MRISVSCSDWCAGSRPAEICSVKNWQKVSSDCQSISTLTFDLSTEISSALSDLNDSDISGYNLTRLASHPRKH